MALKQSLQALGYTITTCAVDVANQSSVKAMIGQAMSTYGQIDILVNVAQVALFLASDDASFVNVW